MLNPQNNKAQITLFHIQERQVVNLRLKRAETDDKIFASRYRPKVT